MGGGDTGYILILYTHTHTHTDACVVSRFSCVQLFVILWTIVQRDSLSLRIQARVLEWGTSLVVQWLRLRAPNAGGPGLIPGQGTRSHMP